MPPQQQQQHAAQGDLIHEHHAGEQHSHENHAQAYYVYLFASKRKAVIKERRAHIGVVLAQCPPLLSYLPYTVQVVYDSEASLILFSVLEVL